MSIAAQLAQGTTFFIAGAGGAAKNITAVAVGYPTIITSTSHGLSNGDYVAIAGLTGADAALLNGASHVITNVSTNTFAIQVNTIGKTITAGSGTATPAEWIEITEVKSIKPSGASATKIDVTDLKSTAKEYRTGLQDHGTFSCDIHILETDPGQVAALAAFAASTVNTYKIVSPAKTRTFSASCLKFPTVPDSAVDGVQTGTAEWQISGSITYS